MPAVYSPSTVKDTIAAVQAVFAWAVRLDVLVVNPLADYKKPMALARTRVITDAEFDSNHSARSDAIRRQGNRILSAFLDDV
jgi:hypothetical protein